MEQRTIDTPDLYTIRFESGGRVAVRADCNRGTGTYTVSSDRRLTVNPFALTRAMCPPGSMSDRFAAQLSRATRYEVRGGDMYLTLAADSGTFRFRRAPN
jgi:para-nitrobenzyl esterase